MAKLKKSSGEACIKILCKEFGFEYIRQTGSHIILKRKIGGKTIGTVVPNHPELKVGTLKNLLRLAKIEEDDFAQHQ